MYFSRKIEEMISDNRDKMIIDIRDNNELTFINCACRLTESCASCGGTEKGSKRSEIKALISELKKKNPFVESNIFKSVENVNLSTVIGYKSQDGKRHHFLDTYRQLPLSEEILWKNIHL